MVGARAGHSSVRDGGALAVGFAQLSESESEGSFRHPALSFLPTKPVGREMMCCDVAADLNNKKNRNF